jgi:hypothetical protein
VKPRSPRNVAKRVYQARGLLKDIEALVELADLFVAH